MESSLLSMHIIKSLSFKMATVDLSTVASLRGILTVSRAIGTDRSDAVLSVFIDGTFAACFGADRFISRNSIARRHRGVGSSSGTSHSSH